MTIKYICEIDSLIPLENSNVQCKKKFETESPSELIEALSFTNGTGNGVPTLEELLIHLFEKRAAYAGRNYLIYIKFSDNEE